jgi:hypothetical protein
MVPIITSPTAVAAVLFGYRLFFYTKDTPRSVFHSQSCHPKTKVSSVCGVEF